MSAAVQAILDDPKFETLLTTYYAGSAGVDDLLAIAEWVAARETAARREALLEAASEQERLSTGPRALGNKAVQFKRLIFANWLRERAADA